VKAVICSAARENLASMMQEVCDNREAVIITRKRDQAVVMISLKDYESICETSYLLRSPANARRLCESIAQLEAGRGQVRELPELE